MKKIPIILLSSILCGVLFQGCDNVKVDLPAILNNEPATKLSMGDVEHFGNALLNKSVYIDGYLINAYPCRQNTGYECLSFISMDSNELKPEIVLIKGNAYDLEFYKKIMLTQNMLHQAKSLGEAGPSSLPKLRATGIVRNVNKSIDSKVIEVPLMVADKLEVLAQPSK